MPRHKRKPRNTSTHWESPTNTNGGKWILEKSRASENSTGVEYDIYNVYHMDDRKHKLSPDCWCQPEIKERDDDEHFILLSHRRVQ